MKPAYRSENKDFALIHGDCCKIMSDFDFKFDLIFADTLQKLFIPCFLKKET